MNKRLVRIIATAFLVASAPVFAGGIPVVDGVQIGNNMMNHMEDIAKYVEQIAQLKAQLEQMQQQYKALTGSRNLGKILYDPRFRQYLPEEWQGVYDSVRNGGYSGLSGDAAAIRAAAKRFDACQHIRDDVDRTVCEARAVKSAQDKAFAIKSFDMAKARIGQIEGLMDEINETDDPKSIQELQARIAIEQAAMQNEDTKLRMLQMVAEAEDKIIQQQAHERVQKRTAVSGMPNPPPINW
jgi:type IV secretion system protein VirB5